ncbi:MAG: phosphodiester glycosidase family protein [Erysipelotrichaceae bacterium]
MKSIKKILIYISTILSSLLLSILIILLVAITLIFYGPSSTARDILVLTSLETSAMKFLPHLYFSQDKIDAIIAANSAHETGEISDGDDVIIPTDEIDLKKIEVINISGSTFIGKLMIVNDPSRVYVSTIPVFSTTSRGKRLLDMVKAEDAIGGINGGAFQDIGGVGKGGMPIGIVIKNGEVLINSNAGDKNTLIGFDTQHKLVIGKMTVQQALDRGVRDAVSFGPALVLNGELQGLGGTAGGLNPRTAIGQRADGAILLLVIDGRQPTSLGASYKDVADVMIENGAVNAVALDGGSSTLMVYQDKILNQTSLLTGPRNIPTFFMVSK